MIGDFIMCIDCNTLEATLAQVEEDIDNAVTVIKEAQTLIYAAHHQALKPYNEQLEAGETAALPHICRVDLLVAYKMIEAAITSLQPVRDTSKKVMADINNKGIKAYIVEANIEE